MHFKSLRTKNILYYKRHYKLVAIATAITIAVIVGSILVGESVRSTLVKRVDERLGKTETILFSKNSFFESSMASDPLWEGKAQPILLSNGFISDAGRLIPVMVWGTDNKDIPSGGAKVNAALASVLSASPNEDVVLRLPATGMVPSGSLFVTNNYTTATRLKLSGILSTKEGGDMNLKNEQVIPYNIFVNREELATTLDIEGKINLILHPGYFSLEDLNRIWSPSLSGISETEEDGFTEIVSDRVFIQQEAVETICNRNPGANRLFSYMANSIEVSGESIPYSFVTALDRYKGRALQKDELILSDYSAKRLNARINDTICMTYYTSADLKTLSVDTLYGRVSMIVPLAELVADKTLSAEFPGLSDVENCTDWDSDLPINMDLITKEDEDYWDKYRSTPKMIVPYSAVSEDWSNTYGSATAIRIEQPVGSVDLAGLDASMFGLQVIHPREAGLNAATGGVDFSSLFLSLGFFIILSSVLLMLIPLSEMISQRRNELKLWSALGYTRKRIVRILWSESVPVVLLSSLAGIVAGFIYAWIVLLLLGSLWKGATQTGGFVIYPNIGVICICLLVGIGISMLLLRITIVRTIKHLDDVKRIKKDSLRWKLLFAICSGLFLICIIPFNLAYLQSAGLFTLTGIALIVTALLWGDYIISRKGTATQSLCDSELIWANLYANKKQVLLSFFTLATGVFIVFSTGLNRKSFSDSSQLTAGTGGYSLWCESSVPIYHNIATKPGQEKLALTDLPENAQVLQISRYSSDDASCLNLNKVSQPTVLGLDMKAFEKSDFRIQRSIYPDGVSVFDKMQTTTDSVYPALIDETVLLWGLMRNLGDTLVYEDEAGKKVYLQLAGTIQNSIFQGNILIDKTIFSHIWREITGSEVLLLKVDEPDVDRSALLLSQALNEYGIRITTTAQRLSEFNRVTDTYLDIFLALGGIGLLLGIMSFIIVVRKNLVSRKEQIALYRSLGFLDSKIEKMLLSENKLVPLYAIFTGILGSLIGIGAGFANVGIWLWVMVIVLTILFVVSVLVFLKKSVRSSLRDSNSLIITE